MFLPYVHCFVLRVVWYDRLLFCAFAVGRRSLRHFFSPPATLHARAAAALHAALYGSARMSYS